LKEAFAKAMQSKMSNKPSGVGFSPPSASFLSAGHPDEVEVDVDVVVVLVLSEEVDVDVDVSGGGEGEEPAVELVVVLVLVVLLSDVLSPTVDVEVVVVSAVELVVDP
jgi:hypothetical protein